MAARGTTTNDSTPTADDQGSLGANASLAGISPTDETEVTIVLAHYMSAEQAKASGLGDKDMAPEDKVTVPRDVAAAMITQGYVAGVNPQDPTQVRKALGLDKAKG